jgi:hypothetical protein
MFNSNHLKSITFTIFGLYAYKIVKVYANFSRVNKWN